VLAAIQDTLDIRNDELVKAAMTLSGGIAMSHQGTCGAVTAGVMAINSLYGRERKNFVGKPTDLTPYILAKKLADKFASVYGSILCGPIQEKLYGRIFNLIEPKEGFVRDQTEYEAFEKAGGLSEQGCAGIAGNAAKWTVEILLDEMEKRNTEPKK
jgi:C_GCAxxG_C_C family probable redox protein